MSHGSPDDVAIPFDLRTYLRDHLLAIGMLLACLVLITVMLACLGLNGEALLMVDGIMVLLFTIVLTHGFLRRRSFWVELQETVSFDDDPNHLLSLVERPRFLDGAVAHQLLEEMAQRCRRTAEERKFEQDAYRQYIELWIHEAKAPIAASSLIAERSDVAEDLLPELERIERLVMTALFYARATSSTFDYAIHATDLLAICQDACKQNARLLIGKGVHPKFSIEEGITVQTDRQWLLFMLSQVILNAAQYGARTIRFEGRRLNGSELSDPVVLEVVDDGDGIPAHDMDSVFDRSYVGENGRRAGKATGMGLYLVALMCDRCGIQVSLTSEEGTGTTVTFEFPQELSRKRSVTSLEGEGPSMTKP